MDKKLIHRIPLAFIGWAVLIFVCGCSSQPLVRTPASADEIAPDMICVLNGGLNVRDSTLTEILFQVGQGDEVYASSPSDPVSGTVNGKSVTFQQASFPRFNRSGWVDESAVRPVADCPWMINPPAPLPPDFNAMAPSCAESLVLEAAKKNVAKVFSNRSESGGECALGVRESLELSGVVEAKGSLGNAVDFINSLLPLGFVDSGLRDPNMAPPGSVIVFSGPDSRAYLKNHKYGIPAGNWCGHVTIKGDDGFYYTDAKTEEPAVGWEDGLNLDGERDVAGIYVPGPKLAADWENRCGSEQTRRNKAKAILSRAIASEAVIGAPQTETTDLAAGPTPAQITAKLQSLDIHNAVDRRIARRMARSAADQALAFYRAATVSNPSSLSGSLVTMLSMAREAEPYDGEGQIAEILARTIGDDSGLQATYRNFLASLPQTSVVDRCKNKKLELSIQEAFCVQQDGNRNETNCAAPFSYRSCIDSGN